MASWVLDAALPDTWGIGLLSPGPKGLGYPAYPAIRGGSQAGRHTSFRDASVPDRRYQKSAALKGSQQQDFPCS